MDVFQVDKPAVLAHPLYERERGEHLEWWRRGRVPAWAAIPVGAALVGFQIAADRTELRIEKEFGTALGIGGVVVYELLSKLRLSGRMDRLRASGFLTDLTLSGIRGVETLAAFTHGNRHRWWDLLPYGAMALAFLRQNVVLGVLLVLFGALVVASLAAQAQHSGVMRFAVIQTGWLLSRHRPGLHLRSTLAGLFPVLCAPAVLFAIQAPAGFVLVVLLFLVYLFESRELNRIRGMSAPEFESYVDAVFRGVGAEWREEQRVLEEEWERQFRK